MKNKTLFPSIFILLISLFAVPAFAQGEFKIQDASDNDLLEVSEVGVTLTKMTTAERSTNAAGLTTDDSGLLVYDMDTQSFWVWKDNQWIEIDALLTQLEDADGDTKVQVEAGTDEDHIRFDVAGVEAMVIDSNARVGIGTDTPDATLDIVGDFQLKDGSEQAGYLLTSDGDGKASWNCLDAAHLFGPAFTPDLSCQMNRGIAPIGDVVDQFAVSGDYAYLPGLLEDDLRIIDVSDKDNPTQVGQVFFPAGAKVVTVNGNYAYVGVIGGNMYIFDISNPINPMQVGILSNTAFAPESMLLEGDFLYISGGSTISLVDVSVPNSPSLLSNLSLPSNGAREMAKVGDYLYALNTGDVDMKIIDISNPAAPSIVNTFALGGFPWTIDTKGNYAYVGEQITNVIKVFDISDPLNPTLETSFASGFIPRTIEIIGNYAFVVHNGSDDLIIYDIQDPFNVTQLSSIVVGTDPFFSRIQGNYAYISDIADNELKIVELSCDAPSQIKVEPFTGKLTEEDLYWQEAGSNLYSNTGGNVGIGTTTPDAKLDVEGAFQLKEGNQAEGKVLTSDADGNATWRDPKSNVGFARDFSVTSWDGSDTWRELTNTISLDVQTGDLLVFDALATAGLNQGSGVDDFEYKVVITGCATTETFTVLTNSPLEEIDHTIFLPRPFKEFWESTCTGTVTFSFQMRNTGDDGWTVKDRVFTVTKY